jgi:hypothetical protein
MGDAFLHDEPSRQAKVRQLARAEELTSLAARAENPTARVMYLQLAAAFRHLAQMRGEGPPSATP